MERPPPFKGEAAREALYQRLCQAALILQCPVLYGHVTKTQAELHFITNEDAMQFFVAADISKLGIERWCKGTLVGIQLKEEGASA